MCKELLSLSVRIYIYIYIASWSCGQSLWLLIMRSRIRFPALPWEFSHGDHGLGKLVEFRFKAPPGTTSPSITTHTPSGQRNCALLASQPQKSVTLLLCPGGRTTKSTKGHVVALEEKKIYIYISTSIRTYSLYQRMTEGIRKFLWYINTYRSFLSDH